MVVDHSELPPSPPEGKNRRTVEVKPPPPSSGKLKPVVDAVSHPPQPRDIKAKHEQSTVGQIEKFTALLF